MCKLLYYWKRSLKQWCSFSGRTTRAEFYATICLFLAAYFLPSFLALFSEISEREQFLYDSVLQLNPGADITGALLSWGILAWESLIILMILAQGCRRLHDVGFSGWWQILIVISITVNDNRFYPFFILFLLFVWSRPTLKLRNKYGEIPSIDSPVPSPNRKDCIIALIYFVITLGIPQIITSGFTYHLTTASSKPILCRNIAADIPAKHTYQFKGTQEEIKKIFRPLLSCIDELQTEDPLTPIYLIVRFPEGKPVVYGIVANDKNKQYFMHSDYNNFDSFASELRQSIPWYKRPFTKTTGSSQMYAPSKKFIPDNMKIRYGISCSVEELESLLDDYRKKESENGKQR